MTLNPDALERLQQLAEQATPGPWALDENPSFRFHIRTHGTASVAPSTGEPIADTALDSDAAYIAAANPSVLLRLLAQVREAEGRSIDVDAMRVNLHATFNGGHHDEPAYSAFHHGMDTVCNVLAAHQKGGSSNGILPPPPATREERE